VRIQFEDGQWYSSVAFAPVEVPGPFDLLQAPSFDLAFDPLTGACAASPRTAENA
jgi:hypothetical protein